MSQPQVEKFNKFSELSLKEILFQFPSFSTQVMNRDFDCYYTYKNIYLCKKEPYLELLNNFINILYKAGIKCKQTSITYKFHSFPIIKIYSYLVPNNNIVEYHKVNSFEDEEFYRDYKLTPCFSPLAKNRIDYYLNFFIIDGFFHYGLKQISYENNMETKYIYGDDADKILKEVSSDKNYNYLTLIKNLKLPQSFLLKLKALKVPVFSIINNEKSISLEINSDLSKYNFYSYYSEEKIKEDIIRNEQNLP